MQPPQVLCGMAPCVALVGEGISLLPTSAHPKISSARLLSCRLCLVVPVVDSTLRVLTFVLALKNSPNGALPRIAHVTRRMGVRESVDAFSEDHESLAEVIAFLDEHERALMAQVSKVREYRYVLFSHMQAKALDSQHDGLVD